MSQATNCSGFLPSWLRQLIGIPTKFSKTTTGSKFCSKSHKTHSISTCYTSIDHPMSTNINKLELCLTPQQCWALEHSLCSASSLMSFRTKHSFVSATYLHSLKVFSCLEDFNLASHVDHDFDWHLKWPSTDVLSNKLNDNVKVIGLINKPVQSKQQHALMAKE